MEREAAQAIEVVVRLAGTQVEYALVSPGSSLYAGRTRNARIALDVQTFAIVEWTAHGFVVRRHATAEPEPLDRPVELAFGDVTISIARTSIARAPIPRRHLEKRPMIYGACSLVAHAALLLVAVWLAVPEDDPAPATKDSMRRPVKIARFAVEAQTTKREEPAPVTPPITADDTPSDAPQTDEPTAATARSIASDATPTGEGPIKINATVDSDDSPGENPSRERRFDPDENPAFDTVKVGNFTTVSTGKAGGEKYELAGANGQRKPLIVVSCDSSSCVVIGGDTANDVRNELQRRLPEIVSCYEKYSDSAGKKVELDFGINNTGKVEAVNVGGVGDYDSCVAKIINSLEFGK